MSRHPVHATARTNAGRIVFVITPVPAAMLTDARALRSYLLAELARVEPDEVVDSCTLEATAFPDQHLDLHLDLETGER